MIQDENATQPLGTYAASEVAERLSHGDTLLIKGQIRLYISLEDEQFVVRSVYHLHDDRAKARGEKPRYSSVERYATLADALLLGLHSEQDLEWQID